MRLSRIPQLFFHHKIYYTNRNFYCMKPRTRSFSKEIPKLSKKQTRFQETLVHVKGEIVSEQWLKMRFQKSELQKYLLTYLVAGLSQAGGPQFLTEQLTLSRPGGGGTLSPGMQQGSKIWGGGHIVLGGDNVPPPPGRDRVNWSSKNWGGVRPPCPPVWDI